MNFISSVCEMLMRLPSASSALLWRSRAHQAVISTACEWCMIIPCMKLTSTADGARGGGAASSAVRRLLS